MTEGLIQKFFVIISGWAGMYP